MKGLSDLEVENEIERLNASPLVKLARKEQRVKNAIKNARRQQLYNLRYMEKRGQQLKDSGITLESLEELARAQRNKADLFGDDDLF